MRFPQTASFLLYMSSLALTTPTPLSPPPLSSTSHLGLEARDVNGLAPPASAVDPSLDSDGCPFEAPANANPNRPLRSSLPPSNLPALSPTSWASPSLKLTSSNTPPSNTTTSTSHPSSPVLNHTASSPANLTSRSPSLLRRQSQMVAWHNFDDTFSGYEDTPAFVLRLHKRYIFRIAANRPVTTLQLYYSRWTSPDGDTSSDSDTDFDDGEMTSGWASGKTWMPGTRDVTEMVVIRGDGRHRGNGRGNRSPPRNGEVEKGFLRITFAEAGVNGLSAVWEEDAFPARRRCQVTW